MKRHLKRPAISKAWPVKRRNITFITRPNPGPHSFSLGLPLKVLLRDMLKLAKTSKEVVKILYNNEILVDGIRRKESKFPVGIMDVIEIKKTNQYFRVVLIKGKISVLSIEKKDAEIKPCKIMGKHMVNGKTQINLYDGKNILVDKDEYKTGDTLVITLPKQEIKDHFKLEKGSTICLIGGKHMGDTGKVEDIIANKITYKRENGDLVETLKRYVFVIGKDKPLFSLTTK
ncbi:MAG: 30S ribosomal protein S4e [Nanoarchaeota archaeon]|nr:30S ribosomal protein S4e [Nanoarchaeota archaeon]MBU1004867.1 30S ribosomal protein S4e [Nanoarchaeota archaeon]MBU1946321.1 30S ribosomal protein S4e [Nanoarchaeota archaeon]